jgi:AcrR family transcriptional regulator
LRLRIVEPLVSHSEREWILIGMAECCAAKGYEETTVADVCAAAGVSRESFERIFAGKDECLGAAMESIVAEAWRALDGVRSSEQPWAVALRDAVTALLAFLAERPAFARVALVESPIAGGRAETLHESSKATLLTFLEQGRELAEPGVPASAARGALAGAEALAVRQVLTGTAERLSELAPDIVYMLAVPYLGVGEARQLATGAARRRRLRAVA